MKKGYPCIDICGIYVAGKAVKSVEALNEIPDEEYQKMIDENCSVKEAAQGVFLVLMMKSFAKK